MSRLPLDPIKATYYGLTLAVMILGSLLCTAQSSADEPKPSLTDFEADCAAAFPDADKLPPLAKWELGLAMQTGGAVKDLLGSQGREAFQKEYEKGGTEEALRGVRERAAVYAIVCGPSDPIYRNGVCTDFLAMCISHGGGGCDMCVRSWAAAACEDSLNTVVDEGVGAIRDRTDLDDEWEQILEMARDVGGPDLLQHLERARVEFVEDPINANCTELF